VPDIEHCLRQVMTVHGVLGANLFDYPSGSSFCAAGPGHATGGERAAAGAAELVHAAVEAAGVSRINQPDRVEEIVVTAGNGYHVVHLTSGLGGRLALYVWLDRGLGNLALAQRAMRSASGYVSAV
jgi:hypothetical protein